MPASGAARDRYADFGGRPDSVDHDDVLKRQRLAAAPPPVPSG
jgi:hypothetical protein